VNCPKCGHPRGESQAECARCGLIFERYRAPRPRPVRGSAPRRDPVPLDWLLFVKPGVSIPGIAARSALLLALFVWSWWFLLSPIRNGYALGSFMHLVILPIHEAGHVFASPFGSRVITSLGGSIMQVLMPFALSCVMLIRYRDTFGAAVILWWTGISFIDLAPYIYDAKEMILPLIGGNTGRTAPYGFHDWNYILTETGRLGQSHSIAAVVFTVGALLILVSFAWGGAVIRRMIGSLSADRTGTAGSPS
jgi:hypothetical protein